LLARAEGIAQLNDDVKAIELWPALRCTVQGAQLPGQGNDDRAERRFGRPAATSA
jgi:hypothetical protein